MSANLDIELLRTFHAILRFGRFLAAASHLNRSPSAVSTHVRRLEELAGGRLFERDNQSVRLTPLGQRFQRQTAELLETHDRVLAGLRRREEPLRVRFGISEEYAGKLLGRLLPRLSAELPALELEVLTDASGRLAGRLRRGQLDLALLVQAQDDPVRRALPRDRRHPAGVGCRPRPADRSATPAAAGPARPGLSLSAGAAGSPRRDGPALAHGGQQSRRGGAGSGHRRRPGDRRDRPCAGRPDDARAGAGGGFAELPAHRIRLAFAPGERPPALERLGELIAEEFRL